MHLSTRSVSFVTVTSLGANCPRIALGLLRSTSDIPTTGCTSRGTPAAARPYMTSSSGGESDDQSIGADSSGSEKTCVVFAALAFLKGTKQVTEDLTPADYSHRDEYIGASVGAHVRHTLDHFSKCLEALTPQSAVSLAHEQQQQQATKGTVDSSHARFQHDWNITPMIRYDERIRGGRVESDPAEAAKVIEDLQTTLRALPRGLRGSLLLREVPVSPAFLLGAEGGGEHMFYSNLERELFFCCHHGHHHNAMIRLILERMARSSEGARALLSREQSKSLGVAPSTAGFRKRLEQQQEHQNDNDADDDVTTQ